MIIDGVEYVRADSVQQELGELRIIVADRGWVFVGRCEDHADGSVTIRAARNIRLWGTTKGLGELASGPTAATKHDNYGVVRCTPIVTIGCDQSGGWHVACK